MDSIRTVEWSCFLNRSGYSQAAQDYIYALKTAGKYDLSLFILNGSPDQLTCSDERLKDLSQMNQKHSQCDLQVFHCIPEMQRRVRKLKRTIGFATFETFDPPAVWVPMLNQNDAVACPSEFNVEVFKKAGVTRPIFHIPHCIDTVAFNPSVTKAENREKFTFLYFGTWRKRKGWPQLVEAFLTEFDESDNVQLMLKTDRIMGSQRDIAILKESTGLINKKTAPIVYEGQVLTEKQLPKFIKSVDCLVSPTMGEGFGIPGLQAMALGVPIIITNYSGCKEYANNDTATMLEPEGMILVNNLDDINQFHNKKWANVTVESIRKAMREVLSNYTHAQNRAATGSSHVASHYNYATIANRIHNMIESVS